MTDIFKSADWARDVERAPIGRQLSFRECESCEAKTGTPELCAGCLHNRARIVAACEALGWKYVEVRR